MKRLREVTVGRGAPLRTAANMTSFQSTTTDGWYCVCVSTSRRFVGTAAGGAAGRNVVYGLTCCAAGRARTDALGSSTTRIITAIRRKRRKLALRLECEYGESIEVFVLRVVCADDGTIIAYTGVILSINLEIDREWSPLISAANSVRRVWRLPPAQDACYTQDQLHIAFDQPSSGVTHGDSSTSSSPP